MNPRYNSSIIQGSNGFPSLEEFYSGVVEFEKREKRDAMYNVARFLVDHFWGNSKDMTNGLGVLLLTWNQAFYRYGMFNFDKLQECIEDNLRKIEKFRKRDIFNLSDTDAESIKDLFDQFLEALQIDSMRFSDKNIKKYTKKNLEELLGNWNIGYNSGNLGTIYKSIKEDPKIRDAIKFTPKGETGSKKEYIEITISRLKYTQLGYLKSTKFIMKSPVAVAKALHILAPDFFPLWDKEISRCYECNYNMNPAEKYVLFCDKMQFIANKVKNYDVNSEKTLIKLIDEYNYSKCTQHWI